MKFKVGDLEKRFKKSKNWTPGKQSFFDQYKRIPRKLKKQATNTKKKWISDLGLGNRLWFIQGKKNPGYNQFLINFITRQDE